MMSSDIHSPVQIAFLLVVTLFFVHRDPARAGDRDLPEAFIDGTGPNWHALREDDFTIVNGREDTWQFEDGVLRTTGEPHGVIRTNKKYTNFEMVVEWKFLEPGGDGGVFVWVPEDSLEGLEPGNWPDGIEINILDPAFKEAYRERTGKKGDFFTVHGDVFPVGDAEIMPYAPTSPDGSRSFPSEERVRPAGEWNHYYIRMVNGEVRLWVNGKEVSGGKNARPNAGYMTLQAEGTPLLYRNVRVRELP